MILIWGGALLHPQFEVFSSKYCWTHIRRLKHPAVPSATLMSSFILLCTNVNLCQPPSLPLPFSHPPHLHRLISPLLSLPLYLLPCLTLHSFLHPYLHTLFPPLYSHHSAFCNSLYPAHSSSYPASCIDIAHFSTTSASLLFCFIVFFFLLFSYCLGIL